MRIYISGQITGTKDFTHRFSAAEKHLLEQGYDPVNPVEFGKHLEAEYAKEGKMPEWENYMRADIELLINCDAIYMLKDWKESKGAQLEYRIAKALKMKVLKEK